MNEAANQAGDPATDDPADPEDQVAELLLILASWEAERREMIGALAGALGVAGEDAEWPALVNLVSELRGEAGQARTAREEAARRQEGMTSQEAFRARAAMFARRRGPGDGT